MLAQPPASYRAMAAGSCSAQGAHIGAWRVAGVGQVSPCLWRAAPPPLAGPLRKPVLSLVPGHGRVAEPLPLPARTPHASTCRAKGSNGSGGAAAVELVRNGAHGDGVRQMMLHRCFSLHRADCREGS